MENLDPQNNQQDALEEKLVQVNRVAKTVKGKGVSFTEGHGIWHHKVPKKTEM